MPVPLHHHKIKYEKLSNRRSNGSLFRASGRVCCNGLTGRNGVPLQCMPMTDPASIRERFRTTITTLHVFEPQAQEERIMWALDTLINSVIEVMEAGKVDGKFPWQSLLFGDCPECGLEVNREWVDATCKRIADAATDHHIKLLQSIQGK